MSAVDPEALPVRTCDIDVKVVNRVALDKHIPRPLRDLVLAFSVRAWTVLLEDGRAAGELAPERAGRSTRPQSEFRIVIPSGACDRSRL